MVSGIYSFGPGLFWDSLSVVGEGGFVHVADNDAGCGPTSCPRQLTYTRDASALSTLAIINRNNIRTEEHPSELKSLLRISYADFSLQNKQLNTTIATYHKH